MPQFAITIAGKAANTAGQTIYPSVIASEIIQASDPLQVIAIAVKEGEPLLVKEDKTSTIGLQLEGEDIIYGHDKVLKKLIETYPEQLMGKSGLVSFREYFGWGCDRESD